MTPDPRSALWSLLALALPIAGCAAAVDDEGDGDDGTKADGDAAVDACSPYAKKLSQCHASEEPQADEPGYTYLGVLSYCINYLAYAESSGGNCREAVEDLFACLTALECQALLVREDGDDPLCPSEQAVVDECTSDD